MTPPERAKSSPRKAVPLWTVNLTSTTPRLPPVLRKETEKAKRITYQVTFALYEASPTRRFLPTYAATASNED